MPRCGLTPASAMHGVPEEAAGLPLSLGACGDGSALAGLSLRDAMGEEVAFDIVILPNGERLVIARGGLVPGQYTLSAPLGGDAGMTSDEDAGDVEPAPALGLMQSVEITQAPKPMRFGEVARVSGDCSAVLELTPDASVLPFLALLSVELQIDGMSPRPLYTTGTLKLVEGRARVALSNQELAQLDAGPHELHVTVRLAGESMPLEAFVLTLTAPCEAVSEDERGGELLCAAMAERSASAWPVGAVAVAMGLIALRKRRRRPRT
jgi:hypothetical protein